MSNEQSEAVKETKPETNIPRDEEGKEGEPQDLNPKSESPNSKATSVHSQADTCSICRDEASIVSHARPPGDWESLVPTALPEQTVRENWSNQVDFLMTCISMSVGFGNIYRFPFVAYDNGGGAFLIPYVIVMMIVGRPIYFFELLLGQFTSCGCVDVWEMAPAFKGLGYAMTMAAGITSTFYSSIMATIILYACYSFLDPLPWTHCKPEDLYLDGKIRTDVHCEEEHKNANITLYHMIPNNGSIDRFCNKSGDCYQHEMKTTADITSGNGSNAEMFFRFQVLKAYLTMFPYVILIALFGVSISLPNATDGVYYFFYPKWSKLIDINVWFQAVQQCFFSLGMGFGPVIVFGSYNNFRHNISRDVWIVSAMDAFTSILAGSTIFAILGSLAAGRDISTVVESGPNIAFVSYPAVMTDFGPYPFPQIVSFLFFFMLLILGLGSGTSMTNCVITLMIDTFPCLNKYFLTTTVCIVGFFIALIYVTPGGSHMLLLMDTFGSSLVLYVVVLTEVIVVGWIYGLRNFCNDIEFMLKQNLNWFWKLCWGIIIPGGLLFVLIYNFVTFETPKVGDVPLPTLAVSIGVAISILVISIIPTVALYVIFTRKTRSCYKKLRASFSPSRLWGPKDTQLNEEWDKLKSTLPYRYHPWKVFTRDYWKHKLKHCRMKRYHGHRRHHGQDSVIKESQKELIGEPEQQQDNPKTQ
ncbi:unnamed protein product [Allacma fusca]|uniref:Sodium-dependent nutrient amino acid transporter 1 n=1 Tax=Allacma fusca TaxID=39272 RepID=A0A8J2NXJ2_9HEXA|nr:unnamed protein product [Allacma fusca]